VALEPEEVDLGVGSFGSSVYGGRPTFALVRREASDGATVTLYELLPAEQATTRRERLERAASNRRLVIDDFETVFDKSSAPALDQWACSDWMAVKLARLERSQLQSILPLVRETLGRADLDVEAITSTGMTTVFLPETAGIRLTLGFRGVKPIRRVDRMRALARGIARMSDEECYYWYAKCQAPSSPNGEKALRTMLTNHL
jgi:hypothetical protein